MLKRRVFLTHSLLFLGSCTFSKIATPDPTPEVKRPEKLRFAVTDLSGSEELEPDFGAFRQALAEVLDMPVEFYPVDNYLAAAPALLSNELDFAMAGPSEYLLLRARANAVPIIGITRPDYYSLIMTRVDSGIETLADLKGKKIAMRKEGSTSGHIVPMKLLMDAGLSPKGDFGVFMLNQESLPALLNGEVDAWAGASSHYVQFVQDRVLEETQVKILKKGENLPPDVFVANPSLGEGFIEELRSQFLDNKNILMAALAASEANQKYKDSEMVPAQDSDYQTLRESYYAIGQGSTIE